MVSADRRLHAGLFELGRNEPQAAERAFAQAVALESRTLLGHLFLATMRLHAGDFPTVLRVARDGLERATSPRDVAAFLELVALALFELGAPVADVRDLIDEALLRMPLSSRLQDLRARLARLVDAGSRPAIDPPPMPSASEAAAALGAMLFSGAAARVAA